ncbi:hypothetical protein SERLA73DRAFT_175830 [Serpula lacrymans var. lacrymans S7.3]|uniref:Uncharacterized protein n=1 Tax=Serpula lacrymans var. lacrymans (strain S7.3) TaxID=936435 RepID=F8PIY4_SERL3|nr:hypothetical protein SERLA73DRAFT_175830 [Serpula lacrymans var. lacrymans S7.3]
MKASEPMLLGESVGIIGPIIQASSTAWTTEIVFGPGPTGIDTSDPLLSLPLASTSTTASEYTTSSSTTTLVPESTYFPLASQPGPQTPAYPPISSPMPTDSQSTNVIKSSATTAFIPPSSSSHSSSLSTSYSSPLPSSSHGHSPLTYIIIGAVVGGVIILAGLIFVLFRCRRNSAKSEIIPVPYTYHHPSTLESDTILPCNVSGFKHVSNANSDVAPSHPVVSDDLSSILHSHDTPLSSMDDIIVIARNQAELVEKLHPRSRIRSSQRWNEQSVQAGGSTEGSDETPPAYSRT